MRQERLTAALNSPGFDPSHMHLDDGLNKKLVMVGVPDQQLGHKLDSCRRFHVDMGHMGHGCNLLCPPLAVSGLGSPYCQGVPSRGPSLGNLYKQHWN